MSTPAKKTTPKKAPKPTSTTPPVETPNDQAPPVDPSPEQTAPGTGIASTPVEHPADGTPSPEITGDGSGAQLPPIEQTGDGLPLADSGDGSGSQLSPVASSSSSAGNPLIPGTAVGTDADPATFDRSSGPITPDMSPEQRQDLILRTARSEVLPESFSPVVVVPQGTKSGGAAHSPVAELGADRVNYIEDPNASTDLTLELVCLNFYGGSPRLTLEVTTSDTGGEESYVPCSEVVHATESGTQTLHCSDVRRYVRAAYVVDGTGPAIEFSLIEPTPNVAPGA